MATHSGHEGIVKLTTNTVAEVTAWSMETTVEVIDDTQSSDTWKTHIPGQRSGSGTVTCHWDETDASGQMAMTEGASVTLNLYPEGDTYYTCTATVTGVSLSAGMGGTVQAEFAWTANGAITRTTVGA